MSSLPELVLLSSLLLGTPSSTADAQNETVVVSTGLPELSADQTAALRRDALNGSSSAANTMALRRGMIFGDTKGEIYWWSIAVENGDLSSRCRLGMALSADDDPESAIRARYWFNKLGASRSADDMKCATSGLENLEDIESIRKKKSN